MKLFKRTVTILLSLILISCICIYLLVFRTQHSAKITHSEIVNITTLLEKHNIKIDKLCLPDAYPDLPQQKLINAIHSRYDFAASVLGKNFYTVDNKTYTKDSIMLCIDNNTFTITFSDDAYMKKDFIKSSPENYGKLIEKAVSKLGFGSSDIAINVNTKKNYADICRVINKAPVFDNSFRLTFNSDGIVNLNGIWFNPANEYTYKKHRPLISIFNELCENKKLSGHTITDVTAGYKIGEIKSYTKEITAYPIWRITLDNETTYDYLM